MFTVFYKCMGDKGCEFDREVPEACNIQRQSDRKNYWMHREDIKSMCDYINITIIGCGHEV